MGLLMGLMVIVLALLVLGGGMRWIEGTRRRTLESGSRPGGGSGVSREVVERLESAIGVLESRVDELQTQQRFLERLLADRPSHESLPKSVLLEDEESSGEEP